MIGIVISLASCKKETTTTPISDGMFIGTTYWECSLMEVNPDTTGNLYFFTLERNGDLLTGEVHVRDSVSPETGTISGFIENDSIFYCQFCEERS